MSGTSPRCILALPRGRRSPADPAVGRGPKPPPHPTATPALAGHRLAAPEPRRRWPRLRPAGLLPPSGRPRRLPRGRPSVAQGGTPPHWSLAPRFGVSGRPRWSLLRGRGHGISGVGCLPTLAPATELATSAGLRASCRAISGAGRPRREAHLLRAQWQRVLLCPEGQLGGVGPCSHTVAEQGLHGGPHVEVWT